jgi:hypothetical protein
MMLLTFMVMIILSGMVHLFSVTWASAQSHARAREAVLHETYYLENNGRRGDADFTQVQGSPLFSRGEVTYNIAAFQGDSFGDVSGTATDEPFSFIATATDTSRDDAFGANTISVTATIEGD